MGQKPTSRKPAGSARSTARLSAAGLVLLLAVAGALFLLRRQAPSPADSGHPPETDKPPMASPAALGTQGRTGSGQRSVAEEQVANTLLRAFADRGRKSSHSLAEWIDLLKDETQTVQVRRQAAQALAKDGSEAALSALKEALNHAPSTVRAAIAQALGDSPSPEAGPLLLALLNDADETTARGAVRGLANRNTPEGAKALADVLSSEQKPLSVRGEAALSLGTMNQPGALQTLMQAASEIRNPSLAGDVLRGLGSRPFAETEAFFSNYLQSPDVGRDLRVAALEAMGRAQGDPNPLLVRFANDADPQARAAAAWAMSATETQGGFGPELAAMLPQENNAEVRTRLYQALANQDNCNPETILGLVQKETQPQARLAGLDLLARGLSEQPTPETLAFFNQTGVPELKDSALNASDSHDRLACVIALQRAHTPESAEALEQIASLSGDPRVAQAARAAVPRGRPGSH